MTALDRLLRPPSIAILDASDDFVKISGRPLKVLLDALVVLRDPGSPCVHRVYPWPRPVSRSAWRTTRVSTSGVKGFCRSVVPGATVPWSRSAASL